MLKPSNLPNNDFKWVTKPAYLDEATLVPLQGPWPDGYDPLFWPLTRDTYYAQQHEHHQ